ncbi:MAG: hypothetical protein E6Q66_04715 [Pedobacter sp.]|nr:MAG: hypothetical protein E6Q66_04715 [Pedobacter sp.]
MTVMRGIKNTLRLTKLTIDEGVKSYYDFEDFDSVGKDLHYTGRDLTTTLLKRDIKINPLRERLTWRSERQRRGVSLDDLPFAEFIAETTAKGIAREVNKYAYYAKKVDGSSVSKSFDGIGTQIAKAIESENSVPGSGIVPVATGEITAQNAVSKFEMVMEAMPTEFRAHGFNLYCSYDLFDKYNKDYRERYKKNFACNTDGVFHVDNTAGMVRVIPCTWMRESQRIIATPQENLLMGIDGDNDMDKIHTHSEFEIIKWRVMFNLGYAIRDYDAMRVNDQV